MPGSLTSLVALPPGRLFCVKADGSEPAADGYLGIARALIDDIRSGRVKVGDKLPSMAKIAKQHGVALRTAQLAVNHLRDMGLVESLPSSGTWVIAVPIPEDEAPPPPVAKVIVNRLDDHAAQLAELRARLERLERGNQ